MINFPIIESIDVDDYDLYPGDADGPGLHASFDAAVTVVVGANGLGKSTMIGMAFRTLTGPFDIPGASSSGDLGSARLAVKNLNAAEKREFSNRVSDGATNARVRIRIQLGGERLSISRKIADLSLLGWERAGATQRVDELELQAALVAASGVSDFADWILLLRYVTFFRDDRQVLFWDRSAQKQLLRSLFLPNADAMLWVDRERAVLTLDSNFRNTRNVLNKERARIESTVEPGTREHEALRTRLSALLAEQAEVTDQLEQALQDLAITDSEVADRSLEKLRAQRDLDSSSRAYEHSKVTALSARFPTNAESALFIWSQLLTAEECLVCGTSVPALSEEISARVSGHRCAVCDSELTPRDPVVVDISDERPARNWDRILEARRNVATLESTVDQLINSRDVQREALSELRSTSARIQSDLGATQAQLPSDERARLDARSYLADMQASLDSLSEELEAAAAEFEMFLGEQTVEIFSRADEVKVRFERYARLFLLGQGELTWQAREEPLGQSSYRVRMPAYELQLARNDGGASANRSGPDDVSESQKEFIDLAFRMALIDVAGDRNGATIVIDTPESSLDAVFSERAAEVLSDFVTSSPRTRLVLASNLTDGRLIPLLIRRVRASQLDATLFDLLKIARPTPAMLQLASAYRNAYRRLVHQTSQS